MAKEVNIKELFVDILMAQYKQERLFVELEKRGAFLNNLLVKNLKIVFKAVGFPEDNSREYDLRHIYLGEERDESKKLMDDNYFPADWIEDNYHGMTMDVFEEKNIIITDRGIDVGLANNLDVVREKLGEYIDWLYAEYDKYERGEQPWNDYFSDDE